MSDIQEEIKEIFNYFIKYANIEDSIKISKLEDYITNLQKENKKLKELCDKYEEEHKTTFEEWQKDIKANKKAIEYIEQNTWEDDYGCFVIDDDKGILLNILKGDNK